LTEIPPELDAEMQAKAMVDAFVTQLQVLGDMKDVLNRLYSSGHVDFQEGYVERHKFLIDGLQILQERFHLLRQSAEDWSQTVKQARDKYYFLNFFRMCELLKMNEV
jgi:hypothetical protein